MPVLSMGNGDLSQKNCSTLTRPSMEEQLSGVKDCCSLLLCIPARELRSNHSKSLTFTTHEGASGHNKE